MSTASRSGYRRLFPLLFMVIAFYSQAGGIMLDSTRIIYAQDAKQRNISIRNTSTDTTFLVQAWIEDAAGRRSSDFIATPPLFTSGPGNENILRLMFTGQQLPRDRETLYYFNVKGVPSVNKKALEGHNALIIAAVTRIKLFVRPAGLTPSPQVAAQQLQFRRNGNNSVIIENASPYFITLTNFKAGNAALDSVMVPSRGQITVALPRDAGNNLTFSTIDDFGAVSPPRPARFN